jgi:hypothetical protein
MKRIDFFENCQNKDWRENILDPSLAVGEIIVDGGSF